MLNRVDWLKNKTADVSRYLSPALWGRCPRAQFLEDPTLGFFDFDDFHKLPLQGTLTTQISNGQYKVFGDTGNTITKVISHTGGAANATTLVPGGFLQLAIDTDNDEVGIADAYPTALITGLNTNSGRIWFEACYMQNGGVATGSGSITGDSIPTNCASVFVGLGNVAGVTMSTTVPLNDGDPIDATLYGIGFRIKEDGLGLVDTVYTDGATSFTNIDASVATMLAWTPKKFGFYYDPNRSTECVTLYINNVPTTTKLTAAQIIALTNLDVNGMGRMCVATADSAGTVFKACLKWWAYAVEFPIAT